MQEITNLKPSDQAKVAQFACRLHDRQLSGADISALAEKMVETTGPVEKAKIRTEMTGGFYGTGHG